MFVRQNSCVLLDEGVVDIVPPSPAAAAAIPESPAVTDDKSKVKSRYENAILFHFYQDIKRISTRYYT